jgi:hypothetical protein
MSCRAAFVGVLLLALAYTCEAGQAEKSLTVTLDGGALLPRHQAVTKDTTCGEEGKCVEKSALTLDCRNGVSIQASVVQPRQSRAALSSMTYKGKPVSDETLHTINLILNDRPSTAVVDLDGHCGPYEALIDITTYADAYLKTQHQQGATIMVSVTTDGQESVQVGPSR